MIKVSHSLVGGADEHRGNVISTEDDGHLYLYEDQEVVAIYAPGHWTSAVVAADTEQPLRP